MVLAHISPIFMGPNLSLVSTSLYRYHKRFCSDSKIIYSWCTQNCQLTEYPDIQAGFLEKCWWSQPINCISHMCREGLRLSSTHFCTSINLDQDLEVWKHCVDRLSSGGRQGACRGNYHPHTGQVITSRSLENVVCKVNWLNVAEYHTTDKMAGKWLRFVMTLSGLWSLMACRALSPETNKYYNHVWHILYKPENSVLLINIRENLLMRASMGLRNPPRWNMVLSWRFFFLVEKTD